MKWITRIFYIILVFFVVMFIEQNGGADGFRRASFVETNLPPILSREDFSAEDAHEGLAVLNSVYENYYNSNKAVNDQIFDSTQATIDEKFQLSFGLYPFLVPIENRYDGFIIVLDNVSPLIDYFSVELIARNNAFEGNKQITLSPEAFPDVSGAFLIFNDENSMYNSRQIYNQVRQTLIVPNTLFYDTEADQSITQGDFTLISILIRAHIGEETTAVFRAYHPSMSFATPALYETNTLEIESSDYMISSNLAGETPTEEEAQTYGIMMIGRPVDLSPYNYWFFVVYIIYAILIIIIPYFMFFHKKIMENRRAKKSIADAKLRDNQEAPIFKDSTE